MAFALVVTLWTTWLLAEQFGWVGRGKARADKAAAGGTRYSARVPPTWPIDIDAGKVGREGADVHWGMETRDRPYLAGFQGGLIAPVVLYRARERA